MAWEDITDILTEDGIDRLEVGQVLMFNYEGSRTELKIMRITAKRKVWVKQINTVLPENVLVTATNEKGEEFTLPMTEA